MKPNLLLQNTPDRWLSTTLYWAPLDENQAKWSTSLMWQFNNILEAGLYQKRDMGSPCGMPACGMESNVWRTGHLAGGV